MNHDYIGIRSVDGKHIDVNIVNRCDKTFFFCNNSIHMLYNIMIFSLLKNGVPSC